MGRKKRHGWEWTLWMFAFICFLGIVRNGGGAIQKSEEATIRQILSQDNIHVISMTVSAVSEPKERPSLSLHAQSAVLMDGKTGRVLYGKEEDLQRPMASTTKIMTCILALENSDLQETVEVSSKAASQPQVKMGMRKGEQYYLKDLLYALMLESYNDSAVAIAEHIGGTTEGFAEMMNAKAKSLGCQSTYFITPNGLDAEETDADGEIKMHSTTARDLARIMAYCVLESPKKEAFLDITRTRNHSFGDAAGKRNFSCVNHNAYLDMDGDLLSGKTGFTGGAGYSYVAAAENSGRVFVLALLGCGWPPDKTWKWADTRKLLDYGRENYAMRNVYREPDLPPVLIENGIPENGDLSGIATAELEVEGEKQVEMLLAPDEDVDITVKIPHTLAAPVQKGEAAGEIVYSIDGTELKRFSVQLSQGVEEISFAWCLKKTAAEYFLNPGR